MQFIFELLLTIAGTLIWTFVCCYAIHLMPAKQTFPSFTRKYWDMPSKVAQIIPIWPAPWVVYILAVAMFY